MTFFFEIDSLQQKLGEILDQVGFGSSTVVIQRWGKPLAAIIPIQLYQKAIAEREARFEIIEKIRYAQPAFSLKQIERDVQEALDRLRKQRS